MATVPIPLVGPTYVNRSLPVNAQITRNFYIEVNQQGGEPVSFEPFPGLTLFSTPDSGKHRGNGRLNNVFYTISGTQLFSIDALGTSTLIGTIAGTKRCVLEEDGVNLVITTSEGKPYQWDGTTLTQGTDVDLPDRASTVTFINRRVVYDGNGGDIVFADLDTPLTVNSLNVAIAESKPDNTLAVKAYNSQVFVFGQRSIEPWYPTGGSGNPPYNVVRNIVEEVGIGAIHSIAVNKDYVYFLGSDLIPYRISGLVLEPIGNPAIGQEIRNYKDASDAFGLTFTFDNLRFYLLSFPVGNETWLYNEQSNAWTNLAFGVNGDQHLISGYEFIYGKHLVADRRNGKIYELDFDKFTDNGEVIQRQRDTVNINGKTFGKPGARVFMDRLEIEINFGESLLTGQGSNAKIMMQYSDDNGRSFSAERWLPIGAQGEYLTKVEWFGLGVFYDRLFRFKMSDPIKLVLISLHADVELQIG